MMEPDFEERVYPLVLPEESNTLVIHGTDPKFQIAFRMFMEEQLGVKAPVQMVIPGGIHDLISPIQHKLGKRLWKYMEHLIKHNGVKRIVIINHEGSSWYEKWNALVRPAVGEEVLQHLMIAAQKLIKKKLNLDIECYMAKITDDKKGVVFKKLGGMD